MNTTTLYQSAAALKPGGSQEIVFALGMTLVTLNIHICTHLKCNPIYYLLLPAP